jgi:hypothetical protein
MVANAVTTPSVATTPAALTPAQHEAATTPTATNSNATEAKPYTVKLTGVALAKSLKLSGQTPSQIALKMGLSTKTVDQYLGATPKAATQATTPTQVKVATAYASTTNQAPSTTAQAGGKVPKTAQVKK